jgi:predicted small lipoprotein YifL
MLRLYVVIILFVMSVLTAACGIKGDLELPIEESEGQAHN